MKFAGATIKYITDCSRDHLAMTIYVSSVAHGCVLIIFFSGGFTTMAVINPPERKLAKSTPMQWSSICKYDKISTFYTFSTIDITVYYRSAALD